MKGKFKFAIFIVIFAVIFGACLYGMAYAANILEDIGAGTYSDSFWSAARATAAVWIFAALSILSAAGIVSGILKSKAVRYIYRVLCRAVCAERIPRFRTLKEHAV